MHSIREMCCSSIVHQETLLFKVTISMHNKAFISSRYMICHVTLSYPGARLHVMVSVMSPNSYEIIKHTASPIYSFSYGSRETVCSLVLQANKKKGRQGARCTIIALYDLLAWSKYITFINYFVIVKKVTNRQNRNWFVCYALAFYWHVVSDNRHLFTGFWSSPRAHY